MYTQIDRCNQRPKISSVYQEAVLKGWTDSTWRMPFHLFEPSPYIRQTCPFPLMPSREAFKHVYLMLHFHRSNDFFFVWVYCLWLFKCLYLQAPFRAVACYCFVIITMITIISSIIFDVIANPSFDAMSLQLRYPMYLTIACGKCRKHYSNKKASTRKTHRSRLLSSVIGQTSLSCILIHR